MACLWISIYWWIGCFLYFTKFYYFFIYNFQGKRKDFGKPQIGILQIKGIILNAEEYLIAIKEMAKRKV